MQSIRVSNGQMSPDCAGFYSPLLPATLPAIYVLTGWAGHPLFVYPRYDGQTGRTQVGPRTPPDHGYSVLPLRVTSSQSTAPLPPLSSETTTHGLVGVTVSVSSRHAPPVLPVCATISASPSRWL